jgi:cell division protein FtsB
MALCSAARFGWNRLIVRGLWETKFLFIPVDLPKLRSTLRLMTLRRSVIAFYALLFVALTLFAALFFLRTYGEYSALKAGEMESRQRLADLQLRLIEQKTILVRLREDPDYVERAVRERLRFAHPDEVVFRFER